MELKIFFRKYFELSFWIIGLTLLAFMQPGTDPHYSFCIFRVLGFKYCPGCGLGHSISYLFHGNISASFEAHPLGIFAVVVILFRINKLFFLHVFSKPIKNNYAIQR